MIKQEEIDALRNDPEFMAGVRRGMHDAHLGYKFSSRLVFGSFKETGGRFWWFYRLIINLKELWWAIKSPYLKLTHRNCPHCREFKQWQQEGA